MVFLGFVLLGGLLPAKSQTLTPPVRLAEAGQHSRDGGIGGTGMVFGTIDSLGSIIVNGLAIQTPGARLGTYPEGLGELGSHAARLVPGETVFVRFERQANGLQARQIIRFFPLSGPITSVRPGEITVMGTRVMVPAGTAIVTEAGQAAAARPGVTVRISGLWQDGGVVASRIVLAPRAPASLTGQVRPTPRGPGIGATPIAFQARPAIGRFASLVGTYRHGRLVPRTIRHDLPLGLARARTPLAVQGYLARDFSGPGFHLSGFGLPMNPASPVARTTGQRALFIGTASGSFLMLNRVAISPEQDQRLTALQALPADTLPAPWQEIYRQGQARPRRVP